MMVFSAIPTSARHSAVFSCGLRGAAPRDSVQKLVQRCAGGGRPKGAPYVVFQKKTHDTVPMDRCGWTRDPPVTRPGTDCSWVWGCRLRLYLSFHFCLC